MPKIPEHDNFVVDLKNKPKAELPNKLNQSSFMNFVQYNNAFLLVLVLGVVMFSGLAMASEEVRDATVGSKQVSAEGVDNTLLLELDLDNFNMDFTITGIIEDEEKYLVSYSYVDFALTPQPPLPGGEGENEGIWQYVEKTATRRISKPFRKDLGLYLAGQLRQEATSRIKALAKLQKQEQTKGQTQVVQVTEYSGLIGKVLDLSSTVFAGYEPVKKVKLKTPSVDRDIMRRVSSGGEDLVEVYNEWVEGHTDEVVDLNSSAGDEVLVDQEEIVTNENPPSSADYGEASESQISTDIDNAEGEVAGETIASDESAVVENTENTSVEEIPAVNPPAGGSTEEVVPDSIPETEPTPEPEPETVVESTPEPEPEDTPAPEPVVESVPEVVE